MGETGARVNGPEPQTGDESSAATRTESAVAQERSLERQIDTLRGELADLVEELDRRRREALDVRLQLRRHAPQLIVFAAVTLLLGGTGWTIAAYARRQRRRPLVRAQNIARALALIAREPDKLVRAIERRPEPSTTLLKALGRVAGTVGERAVASRMRPA